MRAVLLLLSCFSASLHAGNIFSRSSTTSSDPSTSDQRIPSAPANLMDDFSVYIPGNQQPVSDGHLVLCVRSSDLEVPRHLHLKRTSRHHPFHRAMRADIIFAQNLYQPRFSREDIQHDLRLVREDLPDLHKDCIRHYRALNLHTHLQYVKDRHRRVVKKKMVHTLLYVKLPWWLGSVSTGFVLLNRDLRYKLIFHDGRNIFHRTAHALSNKASFGSKRIVRYTQDNAGAFSRPFTVKFVTIKESLTKEHLVPFASVFTNDPDDVKLAEEQEQHLRSSSSSSSSSSSLD